MTQAELELYIPLEKSWIIRMGILDLVHGRAQINSFLDSQENLGDDLLALKRVARGWNTDELLDVGESGTLCRFLLFTSWSLNLNKKFEVSGTLKDRHVTQDTSIIHLSQKELLTLDGGTSQWASAKALLGDKQRIANPPHLLTISYEAIAHWNERVSKKLDWEPKLDRTIGRQAKALVELIKTGHTDFRPIQAEDYCLARALGLITKQEGEEMWPALRNHESDRIASMEEELRRVKRGDNVQSKDHRVVQAIAMWGVLNKKDTRFESPKSVNKTWPQFWDFLKAAK